MLTNLQKNKYVFFFPILIVFVISSIACTNLGKSVNNIEAKKHFELGLSYVKSGKHLEAVNAFKQAIRIEPDYADAHYNLGILYLITDNKGSALEEYKILKDLDKEKANELFNLINP